MKHLKQHRLNRIISQTFLFRASVLLFLTALPQLLLANHGVEAVGLVIVFIVLVIGVGLCFIPTLVYLLRKKYSPVLAYFVMVIDFGVAIFFLVLAEDALGEAFGLASLVLFVLGTLVLIKFIKHRNAIENS